MSEKSPRIAIVHIGKTGGTWLKGALRPFYTRDEVCPLQFEGQYPDDLGELASYRLFDSHIGYNVASKLDVSLVTVLRDPFERIVSLYHYWREVPNDTGGPGIAKRISFEEFLQPGHGAIVDLDTVNTQTWQLAFGTTIAARKANANISPESLLSKAIENLEHFAAVGVTECLPRLADDIERSLGLRIDKNLRPLNTTKSRPSAIKFDLRDRIYPLVNLDVALYNHVLKRFVLSASREPETA